MGNDPMQESHGKLFFSNTKNGGSAIEQHPRLNFSNEKLQIYFLNTIS